MARGSRIFGATIPNIRELAMWGLKMQVPGSLIMGLQMFQPVPLADWWRCEPEN